MSFLSQQSLHLIKHHNYILSSTKPSTIFGFKHPRHAAFLRNRLRNRDFDIVKETNYILLLAQTGTYKDIQVESSSDIHLALMCKLNNLDLAIVSDIIIESEKCIHFVSESYDLQDIYIDDKLLKGNLDKIYGLN